MKIRFAKFRFLFYLYGDEKECEIKNGAVIKDGTTYEYKKTPKINYMFLKFAPIIFGLLFTLNRYDLPINKTKVLEFLCALFIFVGLALFDDYKRKLYIIASMAIVIFIGFYSEHYSLIAFTLKYTILMLIIFWMIISYSNNCYFVYKDEKIVSHFITQKEIQ